MSYTLSDRWKFGLGGVGEQDGLWVRVDTSKRLYPVMECFVPRAVIEAVLRGEDVPDSP